MYKQMIKTKTSAIDRLTTLSKVQVNLPLKTTILILVGVVLALNIDRLILGDIGPLRRLDVADWYVDKIRYCGKFWLSPQVYAWNSLVLRGWPTLYGSITPHHLGCLLGAVLPIQFVFPIIQIIIEIIIAVGSFLFLYISLGYKYRVSLYGVLLNLSIYYFYHENPFVTQITIVPALVAVLTVRDSFQRTHLSIFLRFLILFLIITLAYPPYTLPLTAFGHMLLVFLMPAKNRRMNIILALAFWSIYTLFYAPVILAYIQTSSISNRVFIRGGLESNSFLNSLLQFIFHRAVLLPGIVILAMMSRRTFRVTLYGVIGIVAIVVFTALVQSVIWNQISAQVPQVTALSSIYGRLLNWVSVIVFLLGSYLLQKELSASSLISGSHLFKMVVFSLILGGSIFFISGSIYAGGSFAIVALLISVFFGVDLLRFAHTPLTLFLILVLFLLIPAKVFGSYKGRETVPYGNLFLDQTEYPHETEPYRTVTLGENCAPHDFYAAQASVRGLETVDGNSVYYDAGFAERWLWYVNKNSDSCTRQMAFWSNRVELTADDWFRRPDLIWQWLWVNNVAFMRTMRVLEHPGLLLVDEKQVEIPVAPKFTNIFPDAKIQTQYLYRLVNPVTRAFSIPANLSDNLLPPASLDAEEALLWKLDTNNTHNISLDKYEPSRLEFENTFSEDDLILVSINYHTGWSLHIDGQERLDRLGSGVFGMLSIAPLEGHHRYTLSFKDIYTPYTILCIIMAVSLLIFLVRWIDRLQRISA